MSALCRRLSTSYCLYRRSTKEGEASYDGRSPMLTTASTSRPPHCILRRLADRPLLDTAADRSRPCRGRPPRRSACGQRSPESRAGARPPARRNFCTRPITMPIGSNRMTDWGIDGRRGRAGEENRCRAPRRR